MGHFLLALCGGYLNFIIVQIVSDVRYFVSESATIKQNDAAIKALIMVEGVLLDYGGYGRRFGNYGLWIDGCYPFLRITSLRSCSVCVILVSVYISRKSCEG